MVRETEEGGEGREGGKGTKFLSSQSSHLSLSHTPIHPHTHTHTHASWHMRRVRDRERERETQRSPKFVAGLGERERKLNLHSPVYTHPPASTPCPGQREIKSFYPSSCPASHLPCFVHCLEGMLHTQKVASLETGHTHTRGLFFIA